MGIYFHIPFCKQACNYCDFHFSTSLKYKKDVLKAIVVELHLRKHEFVDQTIDTIYFGGGTPSTLNACEISNLLNELEKIANFAVDCEITLEANPDDLSKNYLNELKHTEINRFSIGTQSFYDDDLQYMNRAHNANEAITSIQLAQDLGFEQINIDLIYGAPTTSNEKWIKNLEQWKLLDVTHLSAYCLTVEENTALHTQIRKGLLKSPTNKRATEQFEILLNYIDENKVNHYEISNFCIGENYAKHNTSYWFGKPYVGIGPSAHSFNGSTIRRWNVANNIKYVNAIKNNTVYFESETLNEEEQINEHILTRLRTKWGLNKFEIEDKFGSAIWDSIDFYSNLHPEYFIANPFGLILSKKGMFLADKISSDLFV